MAKMCATFFARTRKNSAGFPLNCVFSEAGKPVLACNSLKGRKTMAGDRKERILDAALTLFARNGYTGTSMSDIAQSLGITKAALYKHYSGKQEILFRILRKMEDADANRARAYDMPEENPVQGIEFPGKFLGKIGEYSKLQFRYWTTESFPSAFRRMLTLEQYRDPEFGRLYSHYLSDGPVLYMAAIFRNMVGSAEEGMQLALSFYGPMYLLYGMYDSVENKEGVLSMLDAHIDCFLKRLEMKL